jgi:hypothetical protein
MVWGAIAPGYKSPLMRVGGNIDQVKYQQILLQSGVFEAMDRIYGHGGSVFKDDGASPHRAKSTRQLLATRCRLLSKELERPAHSPDLNVIENMWSITKTGMQVQQGMTPEQLYEEANRSWLSVPMETVQHLVGDFHPRVLTCSAVHAECVNGRCKVLRAFQQSIALGQQAAASEAQSNDNISIFRFFTAHLFNLWTGFRPEERLRRSIWLVDHLPDATKKKIGMPHGFHPRE